MTKPFILVVSIAISTATAGLGPQAKPPLAPPTEAKLISEFEARAQAYFDLRNKVDGGAARQTQTREPEKLEAQRKTLAANIQNARAGAKTGDIITPDIQPLFKRLLKPAIKGSDGR